MSFSSRRFRTSRNDSRQSGSSLVELLLYMGIFSILLIVLLQTFTTIIDVQLESQSTSAVSQDAKYLLARFNYDIPQATTITTPASLGGQGSTLQISSSTFNYTYSLSNNNLVLTDNLAGITDQLNSSDTTASNLSFTRLGNQNGKSSIQIKFTLTSLAIRRSGNAVQSFQTTVSQR